MRRIIATAPSKPSQRASAGDLWRERLVCKEMRSSDHRGSKQVGGLMPVALLDRNSSILQ
jgi:hypothetical protein